ncbi:lantibiotic dehydratase [Actinoplanes sp. NPDC024001]|uniref:lantibiotic dehydratase n=1 Tax=Actinoplanes sp. NPDC024001 TaxID=3154598 RepID=UPI0033FB2DF3
MTLSAGAAVDPGTIPAVVAPYALVRLSALPYPRPGVAARQYGRLFATAVACERDLIALAEPLAAELYTSRADHPADFHRAVVLPLRRDVHNRRAPTAATRRALGDLPARIPLLNAWLRVVDERHRVHDELAAAAGPALTDYRAANAVICADEWVRRAAALSSPALLAGLERAAAHGGTVDARGRKADPKILRYALRATTKTSPWSWFTPVGWGRWQPGGSGPHGLEPTAVSLPNHALITSLLRGLLAMPRYRRDLAHRLAPALTVAGGQVQFQRDEVVGEVLYSMYAQRQVRLPRTTALDVVIAELRRAGPAGRTVEQLAAALAARLPAGSGDAAALRYVERLADECLLLPIPPVDPQTPDPLPALAGWLAGHGDAELAATLSRAGADTRRFGALSAVERPPVLRRLTGQWQRAFAAIGQPMPSVPAVREDVVLPGLSGLGRSAGADCRADLSRVAPLAELFDDAVVMRALLRRRLLERAGPGGRCRLAELMADAAQIWSAAAAITPDGTVLDATDSIPAEVAEVADLRRQITAAARACPQRGDEAELTGDLIDEAAAALPHWLARRPASYSWFVQPFRDGTRTGWCVNTVGDGWGRYTSRFLGMLGPQPRAAVAAQLTAMFPGGRLAQFRPVSGFNANLHPRLTGDEIGEDPAWATLALDEVEVVHDQADDVVRLRIIATGERLDVLYLGFLMRPILPDRVAPLILDLGGAGAELSHLAPAGPAPAAGFAVERSRRLRYRSLVLSRACWTLPPPAVAALVDALRAGGDVPYAAAARWAADLGLPESVFVSGRPFSFADPESVHAYITDPKPQFVDWGSALHLRCLARLLSEHSGLVRLTEALPVPGEGPLGRHATELIVETYRAKGGPR